MARSFDCNLLLKMCLTLIFAASFVKVLNVDAVATREELSAARRLAAELAGRVGFALPTVLSPTTVQQKASQPLALPTVSGETITISSVSPATNHHQTSALLQQFGGLDDPSSSTNSRQQEITAARCGPHPIKSLQGVAARTGSTIHQVLTELTNTGELMHQYIDLVYRYINCVKSLRQSADAAGSPSSSFASDINQKLRSLRLRRSNKWLYQYGAE